MKWLSHIFLLTWIVVLPMFGQQVADRGGELVGTSGAPGFVHLLPGLHRIMLWSLSKTPPAEAQRALISIQESAFPVDTSLLIMRSACDSRNNPEVFDEIITWFHSPLGQKVASAERSLASFADKSLSTVRQSVRAQWVSNRRLLLLGRLDRNLSFGTTEGIFALTLIEDLLRTLPATPPPESGNASGEQITGRIDRATTRLEATLRDSVLFDLRVLYRSLSNDDLQQYNEFLESFAGRWYTDIIQRGLEDAFLRGRSTFIERAAELNVPLRRSLVP